MPGAWSPKPSDAASSPPEGLAPRPVKRYAEEGRTLNYMERRRDIAPGLLVAAALLLAAGAARAQSAEPPEYSYGMIPFGENAQNVLRELSGAAIAAHGAEAHFIGQYEVLPDFFTAGLEKNLLGMSQLNPEITRMFRVSYADWDNVVALELFFFRDPDAPKELASHRLFLMRKTLKTGGTGNHTEVAAILEQAITSSLGAAPAIYDVKFLAGLPARLAMWDAAESDIFLLVYQNIFTAADADILYRHRGLWRSYAAAAQRHREAKENPGTEQTRAAGSSF